MALTNDADVILGDHPYKLDVSNPDFTPPYRRWTRPLSETFPIIGMEGMNLQSDALVATFTNFSGEGQLALSATRPETWPKFYSSEGLDFTVSGQFKLNRSIALQKPQHTGGGGSTTTEGNAGFEDEVGTSTTSGTDRRLNAAGDTIKLATPVAPGAGTNQVEFHLYHEGVQSTTTQGSSFELKDGHGAVSGTDFTMTKVGTTVSTADLSSLTANVAYEVNFFAYLSAAAGNKGPTVRGQIMDVTNATPALVKGTGLHEITGTGAPSAPFDTVNFTPESGKTYRFQFVLVDIPQSFSGHVLADKVSYGPTLSPNNAVTISIYNVTGAAEVVAKDVYLTNTATAMVGSLTYTSAAATDYEYRVEYLSGGQRPWLDKAVALAQTAGANLVFNIEDLELGQGGLVWAVGHNAAANTTTWTYNISTEAWTNRQTPGSTSNTKALAMDHTDTYEYVLLDNSIVYQLTTAANNAYIAATTATARGMCIAQNRLIVLGEDTTNGVVVYTYALDQTSYPVAITSSVTVSASKETPDITLRQRMTSTPTGARFFLNYSDRAIVYEVDTSTTTPTVRQIAVLPDGVKATAIKHTGGLTFIAGQYLTETGQTARTAIWFIDQNGVLDRRGYIRRDNPIAAAIQKFVAYQNDLWFTQGSSHVWRYSLSSGGLFNEYQLSPTTRASGRALAVQQGHVWVADKDEGVWVAGSVGTYRQSSASGGSTWTSSITDFGIPYELKTLDSIDVLTDDMPTGAQVFCEYQIDQNGTWTHAGTHTSGSLQRFAIDPTVTFQNIQVRTRLGSATGTTTPTVRAVSIRAEPVFGEEFIDLNLLLADEDGSHHVAGRQSPGGDLAANLWALKNTGAITTLIDGFDSTQTGASIYRVRITSIDHLNSKVGEGRALVRCKVLR